MTLPVAAATFLAANHTVKDSTYGILLPPGHEECLNFSHQSGSSPSSAPNGRLSKAKIDAEFKTAHAVYAWLVLVNDRMADPAERDERFLDACTIAKTLPGNALRESTDVLAPLMNAKAGRTAPGLYDANDYQKKTLLSVMRLRENVYAMGRSGTTLALTPQSQ